MVKLSNFVHFLAPFIFVSVQLEKAVAGVSLDDVGLGLYIHCRSACDFTHYAIIWECSGSVVECLTRDRVVRVFSDVLVAYLYFDIGKYQNMEKLLKHQRGLGSETEVPRVWASPASLRCVQEQDTLFLA